MSPMPLQDWIRPAVQEMAGYTPGEQPPPGVSIIKLNTNENPYPPPPEVMQAIRQAVGEALRRYPEPDSRSVREAAARAYGHDARGIVCGNGSDDLLALVLRMAVDSGETVASPDPSYTLYEPLTTIQGGRFQAVPWAENGHLPVEALAAVRAKVCLVARPNAPTGHTFPLDEVARLCRLTPGIVVLDEAYADFADDNGLALLPRHANLIVTRSFSKSLSLAGLRLGLAFMTPDLAETMHKVRDSYNLDRLAQAAAVAALDHLEAFQPAIEAIRRERKHLTSALRQRGFTVPDSQANFVLADVPSGPATGRDWLLALKNTGILVRHFGSDPRLDNRLRISIGTPEEMEHLIQTIDRLQSGPTFASET
ncbi:MAG: histidinol-phosphate transaminase [Magnetococcales bacterium]|nr:histidinol-phosphate transaminase [Magnetococcales bacterium]